MDEPRIEPVAVEGQEIELPSPELQMLRNNAKSGWLYRYRRQFDWDENYLLYRDRPTVNRLTQRQSVNIPIMKQAVRTLLKDVDDMPVLYFENRDNDEQAELFENEYWAETVKHNNMDLQDIVDKRQVFLFGRSFDQWQIVDGWVKNTVTDPMDILVDRYIDPFNLHSGRFLIHEHIFVPLSKLAQNKDYNQEMVSDMKNFYAGQLGLIKAKENAVTLAQKNMKMQEMGVPDAQSPILGETYVELSMHFIYRNDEPILDKNGEPTDKYYPEQIFVYVVADYLRILMKKPLEEVIGVTEDHFWRNHFPYVTWADDVERQDFWSDGTGDILRTPNKILNAWFSQMVENRTLRNFGMHYYNSNIEGFNPQTFTPIPWGWYGIPIPPNADIRTMLQTVDIPDLKDSLEEMNFLIAVTEKASGATATQQGVPNQKQITLGEVQILVNEAKERVKGMSKFYTPAWKERGLFFLKMIEAAPDRLDAVKIYKKGKSSKKIYSREIEPKDFMTPLGYSVKVWSQDERNSMNVDNLNKLSGVSSLFPGNVKMQEIIQRKALEFTDLPPDDINEVMKVEEDRKKAELANSMGGMPGAMVPGGPVAAPLVPTMASATARPALPAPGA